MPTIVLGRMIRMIVVRSCSEMDITTVFGTVILGSNPGESTSAIAINTQFCIIVIPPEVECCSVAGFARRSFSEGGHGLVVKWRLAKAQSRVRFSLPAQILVFL